MSLFVEGKLFKRAGEGSGGGGDSHNLGYYATQAALEEAHPTAEAGDFAIVGATDTVWIWDTDDSAWVDSDQKGQVTSVNGRTGAVTVDELPDQTGYSGRVLGTDGFVAGWIEPEIVQRDTMPQADENEAGNIYQFIGTTNANYTNGYFYKCAGTTTPSSATATQTVGSSLSDIAVVVATFETQVSSSGTYVYTYTNSNWENAGEIVDFTDYGITYTGTPVEGDQIDVVYTEASTTYSWNRIDVQPAPDPLPSQTGNNGKFLSTNGTTASWSDKPLVNTATGTNALTVGGSSTNNDFATNVGISSNPGFEGVAIGYSANMSVTGGVAIGAYASSSHFNDSRSIAIGYKAKVGAWGAIQLSTSVNAETNSDANTFKVANANGNFEIMSADGTIPKARLANVATVPSTTPTLVVADWSSNTQTITVTGVTASNVVLVSPAPSSASDYASAGIICTSQGTDSLSFDCQTVPSNDITLSVVIL